MLVALFFVVVLYCGKQLVRSLVPPVFYRVGSEETAATHVT